MVVGQSIPLSRSYIHQRVPVRNAPTEDAKDETGTHRDINDVFDVVGHIISHLCPTCKAPKSIDIHHMGQDKESTSHIPTVR
ncbi:hypothetical protein SLA2020_446860 [Shorea laevis]